MLKNRFILLIDFSPYSAYLLQFAYEWSLKVDAELLLVHRTFPATPVLADREIKKEVVGVTNQEALVKLKEFSREILNEQVNFKYYVSEENLLAVLPRLLRDPFNNMIFLGLNGTGILKKIFLGSVAIDLIDNIQNLLVLLPKASAHSSCESLLVAAYKDYPLNTIEFDRLVELLSPGLKRIMFFSVIDGPLDEFDATENYLKDLTELYSNRVDASHKLYVGNVVFESVKEIITHKKDQFLVLQRGSRMFLDQISRTFVINKLAYEGETPLIVIP